MAGSEVCRKRSQICITLGKSTLIVVTMIFVYENEITNLCAFDKTDTQKKVVLKEEENAPSKFLSQCPLNLRASVSF